MDRQEHEPGQSILLRLEADGKTAPRMRLREAAEEAPPELKEIELRAGERYEILGEIARGGVGQVVKARDVDLGRDVAMKILLDRHLDRTDLVKRFVEEAQIGGQLQHPGVVPVYELGLDGKGRPFFAMKLVKGQTLAELIRRRTGPEADLPHFLSIFLSVCRCVAYAHSRGVIHRDLKPSNVMVGAFGEVQVLDWGFAKVLAQGGLADEKRAKREQEDITRIATLRSGAVGSDSLPGSVFGTPAYMPPEQALGEVEDLDERSDVFSLGAILLEILTGMPPYLGSARERFLMAAQAELGDAFERLDAAKADPALTRLAKSCLATLRKERPRDASALAETLDTYLTTVEEREQRSQVAAVEARARAAETKAAVVLEHAAAEASRAEAEAEKDRARRASAKADAARAEAEEQRRARRQTRLLAAAVLLVILVGGGGLLWSQAERSGRRQRAARAVNAALEDASRLEGEGRWSGASAAGARAVELAKAQDAGDETRGRAERRLEELRTGADRAREEEARRARDRAFVDRLRDARLRRAIDLDRARTEAEYAAVFATRDLDVDRDAPDDFAAALAAPEIALEAALTLDEWAWLRRREERDPTGEDWGRLIALARRLDPDPLRNRLRDALGDNDQEKLFEAVTGADHKTMPLRTLDLYGNLLREQGHAEEALEMLLVGHYRDPSDAWINSHITIAASTVRPPRPELALRHATAALAVYPEAWPLWSHLAFCLKETGRREEAVLTLERYREFARSASSLNDIGALLFQLGELERAEEVILRAIELKPEVAIYHSNLAVVLIAEGELDEALSQYRGAIRLAPDRFQYRRDLGAALTRCGRHDAAAKVFRETIEKLGDVGDARRLLATSLELGERFEEAVTEYEAIAGIRPDDPSVQYQLGRAFRKMGLWEKAEEAYRKALEIQPDHSTTSYELGLALWNKAEPDHAGAIEAIQRAVEITPELTSAHFDLAFMCRHQGRFAESLVHAGKAAELAPESRESRERHGFALWIMGDWEGALRGYRKASELDPDWSEPCTNIGVVLNGRSDYEGAVAALRKAVEVEPGNGWALCVLGDTLARGLGRYEEARAAIEKCLGLEFPPGTTGKRKDAEWLLWACRAWMKLDETPDEVLSRKAGAEHVDDAVVAALFCHHRNRPAEAVHYFRLALDTDLEGEPGPVEYQRGARSAARAAAGVGEGLEDATDPDRRRWRADALRWLRAGLDFTANDELPEDSTGRIQTIVNLETCRRHPDLDVFREGSGLEKLPFLERRRWLDLWADIDAELRRYRGIAD